jgi:hypothetical protein
MLIRDCPLIGNGEISIRPGCSAGVQLVTCGRERPLHLAGLETKLLPTENPFVALSLTV